MRAARNATRSRKESRLAVVSAVKGPVAFMHREDIGKLVARGSRRTGRKLKPNYAVRVETKIYPKGGAVASWNRLVGGSR